MQTIKPTMRIVMTQITDIAELYASDKVLKYSILKHRAIRTGLNCTQLTTLIVAAKREGTLKEEIKEDGYYYRISDNTK